VSSRAAIEEFAPLAIGDYKAMPSGMPEVNRMRIMNLPPFPGEGFRIVDLGEHLKARLPLDTAPWPDLSWRLVAHTAWPNDADRRGLWMAAQIGTQIDPGELLERKGTSADDADATLPYLPAQDASFEYFKLFGGHAPLARFASEALHAEIRKIQIRWARVAEILHGHYDMTTGNYMKRRGGASIRKVIDLIAARSRAKSRSAATLWAIWTEYKDVAHLITAAILLVMEAKVRSGEEGWGQRAGLSAYRAIMLAPEAVLAIGKSLQEYGLNVEVHGREGPLFDPKTVWRIPDWVNVESLPPPPRELTKSDFRVLNARRAGRGKAQDRVISKTAPI
jgi:hypothetical protein